MGRKLMVELSDEVYTIIQHQATEANMSPAQVASASLERYFHKQNGSKPGVQGHGKRSKAELQGARDRFESHFGAVDLGYATGIDNDKIDADLQHEYADTHEKG